MIEIDRGRIFKKDMAKIKLNNSEFERYIKYLGLLLNGEKLPREAKDHPLKGEWAGYNEFHLSGDMLLIYRFRGDILELERIGTHNQLFKKY